VDTFGSDAFRYYFLRAIAFGSDGSFSWEDMAARYTNELANGLGNLASRATAMVERYFDGELPASAPTDVERALAQQWHAAVQTADAAVDRFEFAAALAVMKDFVDALNLYLTEQEPWKVAKAGTDEAMARVGTVLATVCEGLRGLSVVLHPVMPKSTSAMWQRLGADTVLGPIAQQRIDLAGGWNVLPAGTRTTKGEPLFPRLPEDE